MNDSGWRQRLADAIAASGKSMRAVSLASGHAAGYVHGLMGEGKSPAIEDFLAVCDAVPVSPIYVMYGIEVEPEDHAILEALHRRPDMRSAILALLAASAAG